MSDIDVPMRAQRVFTALRDRAREAGLTQADLPELVGLRLVYDTALIALLAEGESWSAVAGRRFAELARIDEFISNLHPADTAADCWLAAKIKFDQGNYAAAREILQTRQPRLAHAA